MKRINLFAGVLFVLAGFCAGVAFNLFSTNIAAQGGPPEPPPAALKSVAHDATLTGNGTTAAPLGIANGGVRTAQLANGAVTAPKLSAATLPTLGQVLGFNGANLAWQNAPVGGVRVVDSRGQLVGPTFVGGVLRQVGVLSFQLRVDRIGFTNSGTFVFLHTTQNCSGPRYIFGSETDFVRFSGNFFTQLFYGAEPLQQINVQSFEQINPPANPNLQGPCTNLPSFTTTAGLVATFDLSTLGLVPPFHLEF